MNKIYLIIIISLMIANQKYADDNVLDITKNTGNEKKVETDTKKNIEKFKVKIYQPTKFKNKNKQACPVNSQTGTLYSEEEMKQFSELRKVFPDNILIPRCFNLKEYRENKQQERKIRSISRKIIKKDANELEAETYFDYMEKVINHRIQLLEYTGKENIKKENNSKPNKFQHLIENLKENLKDLEILRDEYIEIK